VVRRTAFTERAVEIIPPSFGVAPSATTRTIMIATLSADLAWKPPDILELQAPLFKVAAADALWFDLPLSMLVQVRRVLGAALGPRLIRWTDPKASIGSSMDLPRVTLCACLQRDSVNELQRQALFTQVRADLRGHVVYMAGESIYSDKTAPLIELSEPEAFADFWPLCQEAAFITKGSLTVRTMANTEVWSRRFDDSYKGSSSSFGVRLRWRKSCRGGRVIAQPAATGQQLAAARKQVRADKQQIELGMIDISLAGTAAFDPQEVLQEIVKLISARVAPLTQVADHTVTTPGQWQAVELSTAAGPSGRLRAHMGSEALACAVRDLLHDKAFQAGESLVTLQVHGEGQSFARRGARC
jgi:hypothetical protein